MQFILMDIKNWCWFRTFRASDSISWFSLAAMRTCVAGTVQRVRVLHSRCGGTPRQAQRFDFSFDSASPEATLEALLANLLDSGKGLA